MGAATDQGPVSYLNELRKLVRESAAEAKGERRPLEKHFNYYTPYIKFPIQLSFDDLGNVTGVIPLPKEIEFFGEEIHKRHPEMPSITIGYPGYSKELHTWPNGYERYSDPESLNTIPIPRHRFESGRRGSRQEYLVEIGNHGKIADVNIGLVTRETHLPFSKARSYAVISVEWPIDEHPLPAQTTARFFVNSVEKIVGVVADVYTRALPEGFK